MKKPERAVHGDHQQGAVGKVDDVHNSENQGQAQCDKGIDATDHRTVNDRRDHDGEIHRFF